MKKVQRLKRLSVGQSKTMEVACKDISADCRKNKERNYIFLTSSVIDLNTKYPEDRMSINL